MWTGYQMEGPMTEREKMIAGSVYDPSDDELIRLRQNAHRLSKEYNDCFETDEKREKILAELIPSVYPDKPEGT